MALLLYKGNNLIKFYEDAIDKLTLLKLRIVKWKPKELFLYAMHQFYWRSLLRLGSTKVYNWIQFRKESQIGYFRNILLAENVLANFSLCVCYLGLWRLYWLNLGLQPFNIWLFTTFLQMNVSASLLFKNSSTQSLLK